MNPGGEPERDETGLPPVDIEIPDDARELDRDVQAYYREQRAARRQQRRQRVRGSLAKDGIVLPLLACCLILALITGTLLTVFSATSDRNLAGLPGSGRTAGSTPGGAATGPAAGGARPKSGGAPAAGASASGSSAGTSPAGASSGSASSGGASSGSASSASPAAGANAGVLRTPKVLPGVLPQTTIFVNGQTPVPVQNLSRTMLVLVPARCKCSATLSWLIGIASGAHARTYLIYTSSTETDVRRLDQGLGSHIRAKASLALEPRETLRSGIPGSMPDDGLAAILIGVRAPVHYATGLQPDEDPTTMIRALTH